jgi:hypothetical protein
VAVQEFCAKHGLSYRSYSWAMALWKSWEVLRFPQPVVGGSMSRSPLMHISEFANGPDGPSPCSQ